MADEPQSQPWPYNWTAYIVNILTEIKMNASGTMRKITGMADGSAGSQDASTVKQMEDYVTSAIGDNVAKRPVHAATTVALPANTRTGDVLKANAVGAFPTIDGVAAALNNEYLVKNEGGVAAHINDGIYTLTVLGDGVTEWELTRRDDMEGGESASGAMVPIVDGTVNADTTFKCINNIGSDIVNTDALEFWFWGQTTDHANLKNLDWDVANHIINTDFDLNTHKAINMVDGAIASDGINLGQISFPKQSAVYHVSDTRGNDSNDGSVSRPLKTRLKAIQLGMTAGFSEIFVKVDMSSGNYSADLTLPDNAIVNMSSYGGFLSTVVAMGDIIMGDGCSLTIDNLTMGLIKEGVGWTTENADIYIENCLVGGIKKADGTTPATNIVAITAGTLDSASLCTDLKTMKLTSNWTGTIFDSANIFVSSHGFDASGEKIIKQADGVASDDGAAFGQIGSAIGTHAALPSVHHTKYTDAEAIAAPDPQYSESLGLSTYTGTAAFQTKDSLVLTVDGTYIVTASFQLGGTKDDKEFQAELHDSISQLDVHSMVPQKKYNEGAGKNHFPNNSLMAKVIVSGASKTISLRYATTDTGQTVAIQNAKIYARRIA